MDYFVININASYNYAMELENSTPKFEKLRFFLSGVLGLENTSILRDEKPVDLFKQSFQLKKYNVVEFLLTNPLNPTYPLDDENLETR